MSPTKKSTNRVVMTVSAVAAAGLLALGGAAIANAATSPTPSPTTTSPSTSPSGEAPSDTGQGGGCRGGGSQDKTVTGSEATKVSAAVTAKYSGVTVTTVRQDPDGSYDVLGTKAGSPVFYEVSKDLSTITERTGGPGMGHQRGTDQQGATEGSTQNRSFRTS